MKVSQHLEYPVNYNNNFFFKGYTSYMTCISFIADKTSVMKMLGMSNNAYTPFGVVVITNIQIHVSS